MSEKQGIYDSENTVFAVFVVFCAVICCRFLRFLRGA
jgi:hypothetical protein